MLDKIVESCRYLLENYPDAQDAKEYLNSRLNKKSQELFGFGYFPSGPNLSILIDMVGEDVLLKDELLYYKTIEDSMGPRRYTACYFENHPLILPFRNAYGEVVGLVGRSLLNDNERSINKIIKYKNTKESVSFKKGNLCFGLYENKQNIIDQNCVYVVEGQFDVIKAVEMGFNNIIGLGTNSMSAYQFSVINRYTDNIFLLLDNDEGGDKGRKRIIDKFGKFANIQNFYLPDNYKDIDEYFNKTGEESVSFVIKS